MSRTWNEITEEELKHLYYEEDLSDSQIANLFGVSKTDVFF